ncbi:AMP-binding protein [Bacillus sp. E214]|uniref:AMP-binding protein n=1 Tax=Bacillus sp. E214 TaxID=2587156 RepID=UPI0011DFEA5E|nr:AMP-binding protein [Bacillus sp. E214]
MSQVAWIPDHRTISNLRLYKWIQELGFKDYDQFYAKSIEKPEWYWGEVEKELGFSWKTPYKKVMDLSNGIEFPDWYVGGTCNIVDSCIEKWIYSDHHAIEYENELGQTKKISFPQLYGWVSRVAGGLLEQGIVRGDRITIYMPMIPETIVAILAAAKIGAVVSPVFSGFAEDALKTRVNAAGSKMIITAESYTRRGKKVDMLKTVTNVLDEMDTLEKVVVVGETGMRGSFVSWTQIEATDSVDTSAEMKSDDPFMLIYTSGTTGKPKGTVHTHTGFPIKSAIDARISMDVVKGDKLLWITDMGWMMGPFQLFASLMNGATIMLYDGVPDYPTANQIWKLVEKWKVTQLGISPTLIRSLMARADDSIGSHDLSSLKVFGSTGEPWNPDPWNWLFERIGKKKIPIINYSGGTEISGGILGNVLLKPIAPVTFNSPMPGMDITVLNSSGESVTNEVGELCIRAPWVGMTKGFWNEKERYLDTYWSTYKNTWVHGDWVSTDGVFWEIKGRSDDTLNIAGKRVGPTEYESILIKHEDVIEAAAIGIPDELKGESCVCFAVLQTNVKGSTELENELMKLLGNQLGKALKPSAIYFVSDLPKTRNQKIMRRVIKSTFLNQDAGDLSSLVNPEIVHEINQIKIK